MNREEDKTARHSELSFFSHAGGNKGENSFLGCGDKPVFEPRVCASESGGIERKKKQSRIFLFSVRVCELKKDT